MLKGDNEEQSEEDLTLVICRNIMALFGWGIELWLLKKTAMSWEVWE
jgi:hypothetical protein